MTAQAIFQQRSLCPMSWFNEERTQRRTIFRKSGLRSGTAQLLVWISELLIIALPPASLITLFSLLGVWGEATDGRWFFGLKFPPLMNIAAFLVSFCFIPMMLYQFCGDLIEKRSLTKVITRTMLIEAGKTFLFFCIILAIFGFIVNIIWLL